jgi:erythromycin esterase-like protein
VSSWNLRDRHMADTLNALSTHLGDQHGEPARVVVWEHNSHLGDARATDMKRRGEVNVGQLVREIYRHESRSIGFSTYHGTVTAATDWGGPAERKRVRPGMNGSIEQTCHGLGMDRFMLLMRNFDELYRRLRDPLLERAIGVIYRPETERYSHYFYAAVSEQFDGLIHIDQTRALEPLERTSEWTIGELAETYPSGM